MGPHWYPLSCAFLLSLPRVSWLASGPSWAALIQRIQFFYGSASGSRSSGLIRCPCRKKSRAQHGLAPARPAFRIQPLCRQHSALSHRGPRSRLGAQRSATCRPGLVPSGSAPATFTSTSSPARYPHPQPCVQYERPRASRRALPFDNARRFCAPRFTIAQTSRAPNRRLAVASSPHPLDAARRLAPPPNFIIQR